MAEVCLTGYRTGGRTMNVALELRNEANGVYDRQPEHRYQTLLLVGADRIEDLEQRVERLQTELKKLEFDMQYLGDFIGEKDLEISHLEDQLKASRSIVKSMITRLTNIANNRTACEIVII